MWIIAVFLILTAVILFAIFGKSDPDRTEWAEEIGRDSIFGTETDRNWLFPPEDPMHYETRDVYKYDEVTLILHFKDGKKKRIRVKDKGEPYDEYHLYLPKIAENDREDGIEDFSPLNAIREARDYLDSDAFSYKELTEQLIFDGFSAEDAEYGVQNCGADWSMQAAKAAGNCLDTEACSYESLKRQLVDEELFTQEQAEYGVQNCGADWCMQAAKYIKEYCGTEEYSKEELAEILSDEGFTEDEINYAISKMKI